MKYISNIGFEHVQGYTQYQDGSDYTYLFTHSGGKGYLLTTTGTDDKNTKTIEMDKDFSHPGGIQAIGKYLLIPCEKDSGSKIYVYDIKEKELKQPIKFKGKKNGELKHKSGSLGITDFEIDGTRYYLLLACAITKDPTKCYCYIAKADDEITNVEFSSIGDFILEDTKKDEKKDLECQGIGLVTDGGNGNVYLIALYSQGKSTYSDYAFLFKITATTSSIENEEIDYRHFTSKGGLLGTGGTHFRWGAGIRITPSGRLVLLATSRNIIAGTFLDTNHWI